MRIDVHENIIITSAFEMYTHVGLLRERVTSASVIRCSRELWTSAGNEQKNGSALHNMTGSERGTQMLDMINEDSVSNPPKTSMVQMESHGNIKTVAYGSFQENFFIAVIA